MKTEHRHKNLHHASNREILKISSHKIFEIEILNFKHIFFNSLNRRQLLWHIST